MSADVRLMPSRMAIKAAAVLALVAWCWMQLHLFAWGLECDAENVQRTSLGNELCDRVGGTLRAPDWSLVILVVAAVVAAATYVGVTYERRWLSLGAMFVVLILAPVPLLGSFLARTPFLEGQLAWPVAEVVVAILITLLCALWLQRLARDESQP